MRPALYLSIILSLFLCCSGLASAANRLSGHPSPYLALHANDPVNWRSWQPEVFAEARARNQLVLVSIGYFSCHWCHVMQRESYQHGATAEILNRRYIAVKVDRELEPDLDRRLIDFVEALRGTAGWPLNVFLTPEGYPLTGFTYLPRADFLRVLENLDAEWQQNHTSLSASAHQFFDSTMLDTDDQRAPQNLSTRQLVDAFTRQTLQSADLLQGGFGHTSRFPNVPQLDALFDSLIPGDTANPEAIEFLQLSLQAMRSQNLLDHVNGGFFRYTTDPDWQTPHFEKMLYDNAMLAALYLKVHRRWPQQGYADTALQTLDFVEAHLKHPRGGYLSSLSAVDSADREGGAYLWSSAQLAALLETQELEQLRQHWQQTEFDGDYLLRPKQITAKAAGPRSIDSIRRKLQTGNGSIMPVDDKRLAAWNAMMLQALTLAADHHPRFAERARRQYLHMLELFFINQGMVRLAGNAQIADAVFEDYAETAGAFYAYARRFEDDRALRRARQLIEDAHQRFFKQGRWQAKENPLIPVNQGKWVMQDLVLYSPMTLWLRTALALPELDTAIRASAIDMLRRQTTSMINRPYYYGSFILLRARYPGYAASADD